MTARRQFKSYYVEISKPAYPAAGFAYSVYLASAYRQDALSPCLLALFSVKAALNKSDALAQALVRAAGTVQIIGGE